MPDKDASTPRVFLIRHGATSWSQSGKFTGISDIPLLPSGREKILETASHVFGKGLLIEPNNLARVYVSPRERARSTVELLFSSVGVPLEIQKDGLVTTGTADGVDVDSDMFRVTEDVAEWGYGDYEGLLTHQIRELRKQRGRDAERPWNIWVDGCEGPGSEQPEDVRRRVDKVIGEISELQGKYMADAKTGSLEEGRKRDILVVAHGHILRAFVRRWLGLDLGVSVEMMLEPGGVCGLSYAHGNVDERAVLVGMSFPGKATAPAAATVSS